nr:MAG TPA: Protein recA [Caudoviricetes sp.]
MSLLSTMFREEVSKDKDLQMAAEATTDVGFPTGFPNFDFMNGYIQTVDNDEKNIHQQYYSTGVSNGSFIMVIGRSGCGKSTFCEQIAANIVRPFPKAMVFEDSSETLSMTWQRRELLTGYHGDELKKRYIIRDSGITAENFYKRIKMIYNLKIEHKDEFMYDTGKLDTFGNPIMMFEPTVYILDSIALLMPENVLEQDELSGGMSTTAGAKVITQVFRGIIQMLKAANIILIAVNHILDDVSINPMMHKKTALAYLKQGETLPRGKTIIYLANTIIRLDDVTKLKSDEKFKVPGSLVDVTLVKSRSARANQKTTLLFNQNTGFDPVLSAFLFMQERGRVHGAGIGLYIDEHKDMKFSMGNFKDKMQKPEFYDMFMNAYSEELFKIPQLIGTGSADFSAKMNNDMMARLNAAK